MLLQFWKNPEFIRHRRAELRRGRATAVGLVVVLICVLTILACWASVKERYAENNGQPYQFSVLGADGRVHILPHPSIANMTTREAYSWLLLMQFGVLTFWSLLSGAQAISRERERGTWDFQRTTRLNSSELLTGKLLGEPVLAYFIFLCSAPVTLVLGIAGHVKILNIAFAYFLILVSALFIGLAGIWLSSLFESKSRGIGLIGALAMYGLFLGANGLNDSPFPGLAAFSPLTALLPLTGRIQFFPPPCATIFGGQLPWLAMSLLLYATFGAWLVLMLLRSLKQDFLEIHLLSRWEAVACCAFLNFVFYALFNPMRSPQFQKAADFSMFMAAMNGFFLFFLGLTMLSSSERLKVGEVFKLQYALSEHGLQWPWLVISAVVSYFLLVWGLLAWEKVLGLDVYTLQRAAISFSIVLLFVIRDVLFIQWCKLTSLRAPLLKGVLLLSLYYAATGVVFGVLDVSSGPSALAAANILTPAGAFEPISRILPISVLCGVVVQLMLIGFLMSAIRERGQQPSLATADASA